MAQWSEQHWLLESEVLGLNIGYGRSFSHFSPLITKASCENF